MPNLSESQIEILKQRRIASIATIRPDGTVHVTAVWFFFDGDAFFIAIPSSSAKARNLSANNQIALMVDRRVHGKELGVSVSGAAEVFEGEMARKYVHQVHAKYLTEEALSDQDVGPKFEAFDDMAVRLRPTRWICWDMSSMDQQAFGGKLAMQSYLRPIEP
ncbi:MAG TPA: pyridoxamine 5'-phosphate oxidase family protein [Mycobacterium sp.]